MQTGTIAATITIGGTNFRSTASRQAEGHVAHVVAIPAGIAGAISAAGVDGLATGHGLVQNDVIDIHWTAAGVRKARRGVTVDTAAANAITFNDDPAAEGDALPAEDTAVVVSKRVTIDTEWDGDDIEILACKATKDLMADFRTAAASEMAKHLSADEAWWWISGQGVANPLASDSVASIVLSSATTTAGVFYLGLLYQSV